MVCVIFEGAYYDISAWVPRHPGGALLLTPLDGTDITNIFKAYHTATHVRRPEVRYVGPARSTAPGFVFGEAYRGWQRALYARAAGADPWDAVLWLSLALYLTTSNPLLGALLMVVLGAFGHQYVHTSSPKASLLTLVGFVSNHWRGEHVFSHHAHTNTSHDVDLNFFDVDVLPLPPALRFLVVSNVIVFRPYVQYFAPSHASCATALDVAAMLYNLADLAAAGASAGAAGRFWLRRILPAAWFLLIDYLNHYDGTSVAFCRASDDWVAHQCAVTQNVVLHDGLYEHAPMVHSLLTFGLDRQLEHHLFPRLPMRRLQEAERRLPFAPRKHRIGVATLRQLVAEFVARPAPRSDSWAARR